MTELMLSKPHNFSAPDDTITAAPVLLRQVVSQLTDRALTQHYPKATLYVVATPIGNLADVSIRCLAVLSLVDCVAAEDTRVAGQLLRLLGLQKPLLACDSHREAQAAQGILNRLQTGDRVALISDAGTPAVSDPGSLVVAAVRAAGFEVVPIPGACSVTAALSASGIGQGAFTFAGFAPNKGADRSRFFAELRDATLPTVLFEAPHRIGDCMNQLAKVLDQRPVTVARELTKQFEQIITLPANQLPAWLAADPMREKGEFVLVVSAGHTTTPACTNLLPVEELLRRLLPYMSVKEAARLVADITGASKNELYAMALEIKNL